MCAVVDGESVSCQDFNRLAKHAINKYNEHCKSCTGSELLKLFDATILTFMDKHYVMWSYRNKMYNMMHRKLVEAALRFHEFDHDGKLNGYYKRWFGEELILSD